MFKKIIIFVFILTLWFISSILFPFDQGFYNNLKLPIYTPPKLFFIIIWPILFILLTITIYRIIKNNKQNNDYLFILIITYLSIQTFSLFFFYFNNLFLSLISTIVTMISSIFLTLETKKLDKYWYLLIPLNIWSIFASILYINIYLIN